MPPLQALLALHGLWGLFFLPLMVGAIRCWPARRLRVGGRFATVAAVIGLAVVAGLHTITWWPAASIDDRRYLPHRIVYAIVISPEVPVVQGLLVSATCWIVGRRRDKAAAPSEDAKSHK